MRWSDCDEGGKEEEREEERKEGRKGGGREKRERNLGDPLRTGGGNIQPNREAPEHAHSLLAYIQQDI